jgi:hypothetical protein
MLEEEVVVIYEDEVVGTGRFTILIYLFLIIKTIYKWN